MSQLKREATMPDFTATERRIMALLEDGRPHTRDELLGRLVDDLGAPSNVGFHISNLRRKLRPIGQTVASHRLEGMTYYRLARFVANDG